MVAVVVVVVVTEGPADDRRLNMYTCLASVLIWFCFGCLRAGRPSGRGGRHV